jgi:hypothetical protein
MKVSSRPWVGTFSWVGALPPLSLNVTLAFIPGCISQRYSYVPGLVRLSGDAFGKRCGKVCVKDSPGCNVPERNAPAGLVANTVCRVVLSLTHWTAVPGSMTSWEGSK